MGKFAIDNPHMELGCRYCGSLAFRSSSSAYFGLFLHTNETTNLPRRFRFSRFLGPYPISLQLAGQAFAQRLFLPVRPHVDMATARAALGTHNLAESSAPRYRPGTSTRRSGPGGGRHR